MASYGVPIGNPSCRFAPMLRVILFGLQEQGLSMKLVAGLLAVCLTLPGCAAFHPRPSVQDFVGKPLDALVATYGKPSPGGEHRMGVRAYQWDFSRDYVVPETTTAVTSGFVGDQAVVATTTAVTGYSSGTEGCLLHVDVDAVGVVVRAYHTSDDYCGRYFQD